MVRRAVFATTWWVIQFVVLWCVANVTRIDTAKDKYVLLLLHLLLLSQLMPLLLRLLLLCYVAMISTICLCSTNWVMIDWTRREKKDKTQNQKIVKLKKKKLQKQSKQRKKYINKIQKLLFYKMKYIIFISSTTTSFLKCLLSKWKRKNVFKKKISYKSKTTIHVPWNSYDSQQLTRTSPLV